MKTVQLTLYSIDELSDGAKEYALSEWDKDTPHNRDREVRDTIKEFEHEFDVEVKDWRYGPYDYEFNLDLSGLEDDVLRLKGNRARAWFWNNHGDVLLSPRKAWFSKASSYASKVFFDRVYDGTCPFTGVSFDCDALDPLAYFCFGVRWDEKLKKRVPIRPTKRKDDSNTVESILRACVDSLFQCAQEDWEYQCCMVSFEEACRANDYTFTEDGRMHNV